MVDDDRIALERIERHLEIVHAGIVVAAAALLHQRAEQDEEIAKVLRHCVGERLFEQIERLEALVRRVEPEIGRTETIQPRT